MIPNSFQIFDQLYWGGDFTVLKELIRTKKVDVDQIRFFTGYSGWSAGQLEEEIKENSWLVSSLDIHNIMSLDNLDIWRESLSDLGGNYKVWANYPKDQNLN